MDNSSISSTHTTSDTATTSADIEILDGKYHSGYNIKQIYNCLLLLENTSSVMIRSMNTPPSKTEAKMLTEQSKTVITAIGVSTVILLILSSALIITVVVLIWSYKRRSAKKQLYTDNSYSTLSRGSGQQIQPQSVQQDSAQLYDQIHLSPSTGQTEFIHKFESANINNPSTTPQNSNPTHSTANASMQKKKGTVEKQKSCPSDTIEELYTAVKKKPKGSEPKDEEETPPIPPHTVEELYTVVQKKPKSNADENKEAPSQTVLQNTAEDFYTAVMKKPKGGSTDGTEAAPPSPPHTVEELYTAVIKESAGDKEEAPPIPPYTVEEN